MRDDDVTELHNDLMRRAEACDALAERYGRASIDAGPLLCRRLRAVAHGASVGGGHFAASLLRCHALRRSSSAWR
jgi:hypothetical protein